MACKDVSAPSGGRRSRVSILGTFGLCLGFNVQTASPYLKRATELSGGHELKSVHRQVLQPDWISIVLNSLF